MSEARALAERNLLPKIGAVFSRGPDRTLLFTFTADPSTIVGPRPATDADRAAHPEAWTAFAAAEPAPPPMEESPSAGAAQEDADDAATVDRAMDALQSGTLETVSHAEVIATVFNGADPAAFDHDHDGAPGGSLPKAARKRRA